MEYFLGKRYSLKILPRSQNLGSICDRSQSLVFGRFCIAESYIFLKSGTRIFEGVSNQSLAKSQIYHSIPLKLNHQKLSVFKITYHRSSLLAGIICVICQRTCMDNFYLFFFQLKVDINTSPLRSCGFHKLKEGATEQL